MLKTGKEIYLEKQKGINKGHNVNYLKHWKNMCACACACGRL
jgi:hypothetical protein